MTHCYSRHFFGGNTAIVTIRYQIYKIDIFDFTLAYATSRVVSVSFYSGPYPSEHTLVKIPVGKLYGLDLRYIFVFF